MDKPSIRAGSRILLLDGGSLDKVRTWDGKGEWENRVSSLTAENIAWLEGQSYLHSLGDGGTRGEGWLKDGRDDHVLMHRYGCMAVYQR